METVTYLDGLLASIAGDWLEKYPWNENLYEFARAFIESAEAAPQACLPEEYPEEAEADQALLASCRSAIEPMAASRRENPAILELASQFKLSPHESAIIEFFFAYCSFSALESYFDKLPMWDQLRRLARFSRLPESEVFDQLRNDGRLYRLGIGSNEYRGIRISPHGIFFGLASPILAFIAAEARRPLSSFILTADEKMPLPLSAYDLPEPAILAAQAALRSPRGTATILLYGKPGTGKTEFSRSLCSSIGMKALFLRTDPQSGNRSFSSLQLASRLADPSREILVLDEADVLLNVDFGCFPPPDSSPKKGAVNEFLDSAPARMIFISNLTQRIPDSILRRFSCHIGFEDYGPAQRRRIWDSLTPSGELFTDLERQSLASRFKANPARVKQVVEVCASYASDADARISVMDIATDLLARSDELMYGIDRKPKIPIRGYDARFLSINTPMEGLLRRVELWQARFDGKGSGINLLFYGLPGTGKTAFALHLTERLGLCPVVKRGSDLLSMWVGETEKNIRRAFKEAEGAALIIDEADSLLSSREQATHSWERTQVNEILTAMESFPGLFIASTNLRRVLDSASLRRFTYKVEFLATAPEKRLDLVTAYFPALSWSDGEAQLLSGLDSLTPGDVAVVARRLEHETDLSTGIVLDELRGEISCREPRREQIGFH